MRIVLDLQGTQADNRYRGIGRYSLSLAQAIARNRGAHEVIIALNGLFPETILPLRAAFHAILPADNIRVWYSPGRLGFVDANNNVRRSAAELVREAFMAELEPDLIHVSSIFEGLNDDAVTSISRFSHGTPTAVTLYDLIPYIHRTPYLDNPGIRCWYEAKLGFIRCADLLLAISETSRQDAMKHLAVSPDAVVTISAAVEAHFRPNQVSQETEFALRKRYGIRRPFVMYTGGIDHRKNIDGLIRAYARLPLSLRQTHQLAIICSMDLISRQTLEQLAAQQGLGPDEVILTGYVPDGDLSALYNLCKLFVFPSLYEGFGLPALEAMSCGAPVIGSNTSSVPEVIGREDALFDPRSDEDIATKVARVLTDESYRSDLARHSTNQSKKFSWDDSARRAIDAFERLHAQRKQCRPVSQQAPRRKRLAFVSPLPPARSGIADFSAELLPELARHYDLDVVVDQLEVADPWVLKHCAVRSPDWLQENANRVDRVLYHFGNSAFHHYMLRLLDAVPGTIVLHDFFLGHFYADREVRGLEPLAWGLELYQSHGYEALREYVHTREEAGVVWKYPTNLSILRKAHGVIVHSEYSRNLGRLWYGDSFVRDWVVIPLMRASSSKLDRESSRKSLAVADGDLLVCSFGMLGPNKQSHRLLAAWLKSSLAQDEHCHLAFIGENPNSAYGLQLVDTIRRNGLQDRIHITGWVDHATFRRYLAAADLAVQLRTLSRGETSAAVLDCMNHGLPTIVNANGSAAELPRDATWMLADDFDEAELLAALETLARDANRRSEIGAKARQVILERHSPEKCAQKYARAIEYFQTKACTNPHALITAIAAIRDYAPNEDECVAMAQSIAQNQPERRAFRQVLIDVSELVRQDVQSGIQRVTRSILNEFLLRPPMGFRVEPVYGSMERPGYRYARDFTARFLGCPCALGDDEAVDTQPGDIFLGLDFQPHIVPAQRDSLDLLHRTGVRTYFVVYDLLPLTLSQAFLPGADQLHSAWLSTIARYDGAICISRAVADEFRGYFAANCIARLSEFRIGWFHLGADVESSVPSCGLPREAPQVLSRLSARNAFLMVGTLEPRKSHAQVLTAFERLWKDEVDVNLVIVGKQGWQTDELAGRIRAHPEIQKRLFWLEGISDEYLGRVYAASTCLIAASWGEGFGLPLIEATRYHLSIIARDIPVFREVAGDNAYYFSGPQPEDVVGAVREWLNLLRAGRVPSSMGIPRLTWASSSRTLMAMLTDPAHPNWVCSVQTTRPKPMPLVQNVCGKSISPPPPPSQESPLQLYRGYCDEDVEMLRSVASEHAECGVDHYVDGFGVKTQYQCVPFLGPSVLRKDRLQLPVPDDGFHAEAIEYVALADALRRFPLKKERFCAVELGAAWGPWISAAGVIARRWGVRDVVLAAVESSPLRFDLMRRHLAFNGLRPLNSKGQETVADSIRTILFNGAVWTEDGEIFFPESEVTDMGAAATKTDTAVDYRDAAVRNVPIPCRTLPSLLKNAIPVDYMHIDVQGAEFDIVKHQITWASNSVKSMLIATHSRAIEGKLIELLLSANWRLHREKPCRVDWGKNCSLTGRTTADGTQYWINSSFCQSVRADEHY